MIKKRVSAETELFKAMIELQYGQKVEEKLKKVTQKIPWAHGWPDDKKAFWNAEAFMWGRKIEKEKRKLIEKELKFLRKGKNLDLGGGAYSYLPSVGFDLSGMMLKLNEHCREKIVGDLEEKLPFSDDKFDSITAVFVLNYVENYQQLLSEIKRVLKKEGIFIMVLSSKKIDPWPRQKEINNFSNEEWTKIIEDNRFIVNFYEKECLWFFECKK